MNDKDIENLINNTGNTGAAGKTKVSSIPVPENNTVTVEDLEKIQETLKNENLNTDTPHG